MTGMKFRDLLRQIVEERHLNQTTVARLCKVSQPAVSRWLKGEQEPDLATAIRVGKALGMSERDLILALGIVDRSIFSLDERDVAIPVLAHRIPCGPPGEEIESCVEGYQVFKRSLLPDGTGEEGAPVYLVRARGNSMQDDGIHDGDRVIFSPEIEPQSGDLAVIHVEDEGFTIKRIFFNRDSILLQSAHPDHPPRFIDREEGQVRIIGRVLMHIGYH